MIRRPIFSFLFFFNDTATTEIYTLSLHDALPICAGTKTCIPSPYSGCIEALTCVSTHLTQLVSQVSNRSEEHTSELQSRLHLVCRLLLEKKKNERQTDAHAINAPCNAIQDLPRHN